MKAKELLFSTDARSKLMTGVNLLADAVQATLGPRGRNAILYRRRDLPNITKDGVTVAEAIKLKDYFEDMGAQLVKEVASQTNEVAGDGTTTATVLARAIAAEGMKALAAGMDPMSLKRGIDLAVDEVVKELKRLAQPMDTRSMIAHVASISANSDTHIGELIASAVDKVGRDGVITVHDSAKLEDELEVVEGMQVDSGLFSPYFVNNHEMERAERDDVRVLIIDEDVHHVRHILPLLKELKDKSLLIIANHLDDDTLTTLALNTKKNTLSVIAAESPAAGQLRTDILEDIALFTDATIVSPTTGVALEDVTVEHLGRAERVLSTRTTTTIIRGGGDKEHIAARVAALTSQLEAETDSTRKELLRTRRGKLTGRIAVIKAGGATEIAKKEKKYRLEDALNATRAAVEEGIVPGGGVALVRAGQALETFAHSDLDHQAGINILKKAIQAPLRQIAMNAGVDDGVVLDKVLRPPMLVAAAAMDDIGDIDLSEITRPGDVARVDTPTIEVTPSATFGYNAATGEYGDLIQMGVIDPVKVTRCALQNAASVAGLLITTEVGVADLPTPDDAMTLDLSGE